MASAVVDAAQGVVLRGLVLYRIHARIKELAESKHDDRAHRVFIGMRAAEVARMIDAEEYTWMAKQFGANDAENTVKHIVINVCNERPLIWKEKKMDTVEVDAMLVKIIVNRIAYKESRARYAHYATTYLF